MNESKIVERNNVVLGCIFKDNLGEYNFSFKLNGSNVIVGGFSTPEEAEEQLIYRCKIIRTGLNSAFKTLGISESRSVRFKLTRSRCSKRLNQRRDIKKLCSILDLMNDFVYKNQVTPENIKYWEEYIKEFNEISKRYK